MFKGVLGAGALAGLTAHGTASASASGSGGGDDVERGVEHGWGKVADGKEQLKVRWLLSHQAGLPIVDGPLTFEQSCAWHPVIRALEAQKPLWQPGTQHVYHAVTYGFLVREVVRRITGKSLGTFFAEEVAAPLGLNAWIGLPEKEERRVARIENAAPFSLEELIAGMIKLTGLDANTVTAWITAMWAPGSVQARAGELGGALNIPADRSFYMSLGFMRACPPMPMVGPGSFGHPGSGGSMGFADPDAGVGYVTNLWNFRPDDLRASNLAKTVRSCLGAPSRRSRPPDPAA
ncbi:serine hydrolase domain-containing protein [Nonomuraea jabiensis]|uniref:serine hydrolase domain-containing protein n=1 Tax=Nonomuraea jabiensis TaxID=882448 RepID=UPI00341BB2EE